MNTEAINTAFEEMIGRKKIHEELDIPANRVYQYRNQLKKGPEISLDKKLELLRKSGWREDEVKYGHNDLISLLNFYKRTSQAARDQGPEYVIEKWRARK